jgi:nitroreductase
MELTDVLRTRRMTRNFSGRPLGTDIVDQLVGTGLRAPSAGNTQGREFVVLEGASQTSLYWQAATDEGWRSRSRRFEGMSRAPVIVLPFADPEAYSARYREPDKSPRGPDVEWVVPYWFVDTAFATMAILLAATDRGIGAAFLGNFRGEEALRAVLGVPDRLRLLGAVLLGESSGPDPPSTSADRPHRTLEDSVHRGGW